MNVLVVHNRYREAGGEDRVVELESRLLARHGHTVVEHLEDNSRIAELAPASLAVKTFWNRDAYRRVRSVIRRAQIDLLHVHNTLPLASPAVFYAAAAEGIPVVHTLHNYRLLCPGAVCFRGGHACVECVDRRVALPALRHACYRGSSAATATVAAMLWAHRTAGTWKRVAAFIAPSEFARRMFVAGGFPAGRIFVKPHFVDPDPGAGTGGGRYAIFVGRLCREKGIEILLEAWRLLNVRVPLVIVGDGPLAQTVAAAAAQVETVRWLGRQRSGEVRRLIHNASFLIFPSLVYETFGQVIGEAYASGTPVIATSGGAAAELVEHERTGLLVRAGDAQHLAEQIGLLWRHPNRLTAMRAAARAAYESRLTADANYRQLTEIYRHALQRRQEMAMTV
jgi:glycosyltransferase involved in cell wall biosynthesis